MAFEDGFLRQCTWLTEEQAESIRHLSRNLWGSPIDSAVATLAACALCFALENAGIPTSQRVQTVAKSQ